MGRTRALLRADESALAVAIVAVLVAGIVAAFLLPTVSDRTAARESGSLFAPPSFESFRDSFGAPGAPSALIGGEAVATPGGSAPAPEPAPPSPGPRPPGGEEPPPEEGLLGLLPDVPILPPPPPLLRAILGGR